MSVSVSVKSTLLISLLICLEFILGFSESKPNTCNNKVDITVIIIIGINTKIQAITENPKSHNIFIINVNTIIIINFKKAEFITPL